MVQHRQLLEQKAIIDDIYARLRESEGAASRLQGMAPKELRHTRSLVKHYLIKGK